MQVVPRRSRRVWVDAMVRVRGVCPALRCHCVQACPGSCPSRSAAACKAAPHPCARPVVQLISFLPTVRSLCVCQLQAGAAAFGWLRSAQSIVPESMFGELQWGAHVAALQRPFKRTGARPVCFPLGAKLLAAHPPVLHEAPVRSSAPAALAAPLLLQPRRCSGGAASCARSGWILPAPKSPRRCRRRSKRRS